MPLGSLFSCAGANNNEGRKKKKSKRRKAKDGDLEPSAPNASNLDIGNGKTVVSHHTTHKQSIPSLGGISDYDEVGNFWDVDHFKVALKRCDNGYKLSSLLQEMITERAKVEDNYAKALKNWCQKWTEHLMKDSPEYETTKDAWFAMLTVGEQQSDIHVDTCKELINKPAFKVKQWMKDNYAKHYINYKVTKDFEDKFEEAQKPWEKMYERMSKAKKEYHDAAKTTINSFEAARSGDSNTKLTEEQRNKLHDKANQASKDEANAKQRYEEVLKEMDLYKGRYMENMSKVFEETQRFEQNRMLFFKQIFEECYRIMQTHQDERYDQAFARMLDEVSKMDPRSDLEWWANQYGTGTTPVWPEFEPAESRS